MKHLRSLAILLLIVMVTSSFVGCVAPKATGTPSGGTETRNDSLAGGSSEQAGVQTDSPMVGPAGISVTVEFTKPETGGDDPEMDTAAALVKQWASSQLSYDYARHFVLFQQEFVDSEFLPWVSPYGMTYKEAIAAIALHASELIPWNTVFFRFTFDNFHVPTESEKQELLNMNASRFKDAGVDISGIKEIRTFVFADEGYVIDNLFPGKSGYDHAPMWMYLYGDTWYLSPDLMDIDASVDMACTDPTDDDGFYKQETLTGTVKWIEGNYVRVDNTVLFFSDVSQINRISVGDTVFARYYSGFYVSDPVSGKAENVEVVKVISFEIMEPDVQPE